MSSLPRFTSLVAVLIAGAGCTASPSAPAKSGAGAPNPELIRADLRVKATPEVMARLNRLAIEHPKNLISRIGESENDLPAKERAAQVLVKGVSDDNLRLLAPLLGPSTAWPVKKAILDGLAHRNAVTLKPELVRLVTEFRFDAQEGREVREAALRIFATMADPEGAGARDLQEWVDRARATGPSLGDLVAMANTRRGTEPALVAAAVDLIVAELPETTTDQINAKNRFVAGLMTNPSEAAATVLEAIVLGSSGRHAKTQAIYAVGNKARPRNGEILLKVIQECAPALATEAAYVLRLVKNFLPESGLPVLETALRDGQGDLSIALAASMLEASERTQRSPRFIAVALDVAVRFKGAGGPRERDLKLHLAEYGGNPVQTLRELRAEIGWRVLDSSAVENVRAPGMADLLVEIFRDEETPDSLKIRTAMLLGKGGGFERISDEALTMLEKTPILYIARDLSKVIRTYGEERTIERLEKYIDTLPRGGKREVLSNSR